MGTVKYTGPVASFHCPTNADIRSLKVHFSPKQLGEGTPSPENVREIEGWDGVEVEQRGKNLFDADNVVHTSTNCWVSSNSEHKITNSNVDRTVYIPCLPNTTYTISKSVGNVLGVGYTTVLPEANVPTFSYYRDNSARVATVTTGADAKYLAIWYYDGSKTFDKTVTPEYIYRTLQVELGSTATPYEPYRGGTTNYTFGVLGKNKFPLRATNQFLDTTTGNSNTIARDMTTGDVYVNISSNNYWQGKSATRYGISIGDGAVSFHTNDNSYGIGIFAPVLPDTTYTLSHSSFGGKTRIGYYDADGQHLNVNLSKDTDTITFTTDSETAYILVVFCSTSGNDSDYTVSNIQLELGSTATTYEPYDPNHTVYGGWVDLITGEVCEEYNHITLDSTSPFNNITTIDKNTNLLRIRLYLNYITDKTIKDISTPNLAYFNYLKSESVTTDSWNGYFTGGSINPRLTVYVQDSNITSIETFLNYLDVHPLEVCYELATPVTYHLAPTQLQTFLGQNNVWSNADYVEVEYDLHETQDILARKQFIIANQPHVEEASGAIATFNTDMAAKLKECKVGFKPKQDLHGYSKPWVGGAGKNLFNINAVEQNPSDTTAINTTLRVFEPNTYCVGTSYSNYFYPTKINSYSVSNNILAVNSDTGYAVGFAVKAAAETTYFISASITNGGRIGVAYYDSTGQWISGETNKQNKSFTTPANTDIVVLCFNSPSNQTEVSYSNIQLEVGSSATSYEPYENICPIEGWTWVEVTRCGKNFSTAATGTEITQKWPTNNNSSRELLFTGMQPGQEFTLSASFTKASEPSSNKRLYLNGSQKTNSTTNAIFQGPSADGPRNAVIHNWVDTDGTIRITHNNRGLTYNDDFIEYAASLQNIQLEVGDTATEFEPYNGETIPVTFPASINLLDTVAKTANKTLSSTGEEISESGMTVTTFIKVSEGSEYTLTFTSTEGARTRRIYGYDSNKDPVQALASASWVNVDSVGTLQATIPSGIEYIRVCYKTADTNISLIGPESSIFYGGYVDLVNGELVQTWNCIKANERTWSNYSAYQVFYTNKSDRSADSRDISDKLRSYTGYGWSSAPDNSIISGNRNSMFIKHLGVSSNAEFKEWLDEVDPIVYYELAEPIHYTLSPSQLKSLRGINNVWSNTNDNITIKYWKH